MIFSKSHNYLIALSVIIFACFAMSNCQRSVSSDAILINCSDLKAGIIIRDSESVEEEINKFVVGLEPNASSVDEIGHRKNINTLVSRINASCSNLTAELVCYACIETNPAQSEIKLTTDSSGTEIIRVLDILTPEDDELKYWNMH